MTVLVVADSKHVAANLVDGLVDAGFPTVIVSSARAAIPEAAARELRAVILDLELSDGDSQLLITVFRQTSDIPILVLTTPDALDERVQALERGADDYLVKPFASTELIGRLRAAQRRPHPAGKRSLSVGDVSLVDGESSMMIGARAVPLSPRERALVELLITHLGQVVSRRDILCDAFGYDVDPGTNIVEVHIRHVRRKLTGARLVIDSVRGFGFRAREVE